jgi:hypothetical protein
MQDLLYTKLMSEKVIGYLLIAVGILVILFTGIGAYQVLTAQGMPAEFITATGPTTINLEIPLGDSGQTVPVPLDIGSMVPVHRLINTSIHIVLMGFLASLGGKLAMIGTNLARPIIVKPREITTS